MARTFTRASSDGITTSIGRLSFNFGPGTAAAIAKKSSDSALMTLISLGSGDDVQWYVSGGNTIGLWNGSALAEAVTYQASDGWCLVAVTKDTGTVAPRMHKYVYSTNTWTHTNSASTLANSGTPGTGGYIGQKNGGDNFDGDINIAAVWDTAMTDIQVEALAYDLISWFAAQPRALWLLDQSSTSMKVNDLSGGGANQSAISGTAVSTASVPVWSPGGPILVSRHSTVAAGVGQRRMMTGLGA